MVWIQIFAQIVGQTLMLIKPVPSVKTELPFNLHVGKGCTETYQDKAPSKASLYYFFFKFF